MKRYLWLLVAVFALIIGMSSEVFAQGIPHSIQKQRMEMEARRAPLLGAEWKAHGMTAADVGAITGLVYSGTAKTPTPTVKLGGQTLTAGTDFDFSYTNNVNAGHGYVFVTAKKLGYYGEQAIPFTIAKFDLANATVSNITDQVYTGSKLKPTPSVVVGGSALVFGTDFDCDWQNNVQFGSNTAVCVVYGLGNYGGKVEKRFSIVGQ